MDSYNSGSLQSSSGGDEEYDSRAAVSARFIPTPQQPVFFDPISSYLPDPNMALPKSDFINNPFTHLPLGSDPPPNPNPSPRNPRKRSRASRRAPTTVLTTDTTNFRAMVQEFTGIPSPPFNSSRTRLDLLIDGQTPPPYLRRPFAQKFQSPFPFLGPSNSSPLFGSAANNDGVSVSSINYQLPNSDVFNINQNPNFKFPFFNSALIDSKSQSIPPIELISGNDDAQFGLGNQIPPILLPADHREKPPESAEGAAARGESAVESWICSSE